VPVHLQARRQPGTSRWLRIEEVRITRLLDKVFYASAIVAGPAGRREVDARPSDAVNLALTADIPIRVDSKLFATAAAIDRLEESSSYPDATADMAAETQQRMRDLLDQQAWGSGAR
jgi:uncharacterized protein